MKAQSASGDYGIFTGDADIEMRELAAKAKATAACDHTLAECEDKALHPEDCPLLHDTEKQVNASFDRWTESRKP